MPLIRWSIQEVRRIAIRLAQRRINPAHIITWPTWRRAHQAAAWHAHITRKTTVMLGCYSAAIVTAFRLKLHLEACAD